jgi:hypothetical protein
MRRTLFPLIGAVVALAGCGSSSSSSQSASSPAATELSYFPSGTPFVMTIATDPNSSAMSGAMDLIGRFPLAGFGLQAVQSKLAQLGIDYSSQIKPLLGNPIAVGVTGTSISGASTGVPVLAVFVSKSASQLKSLVAKVLGGVPSGSTRDGASLYRLGSAELAIDGATAVLGDGGTVPAALDRHAHGGGITTAQFAAGTSGLPQNTLMEAFGNLGDVLSQPSAASARRIPWISAIRSYGATLSASSSGLTLRYRLDTGGRTLTSGQVPIASGTTTPRLVTGAAPIVTGIHDPAQIVTFAEGAAQAVDPSGYASFLKHAARFKAKTGIDFNSVASLLTGDLDIDSDTHTTVGRATVSNPVAMAQTLSKLAHAPSGVFKHGVSFAGLGGGFYAIREPKVTINVGVVGNQLVAGRATAAQLRAFARAPTAPAAGAPGSVSFRIGLLDLLKLTLRRAPPVVVQTILNSVGDITGSAAASPSALTGSASIAIK